MHLHDAEDLALDLMADYGLSAWNFGFDNAKRRCGRCNYVKRLITLSRHYVELNNEREVRDTILHEIAHALTPGAKHGPQWQATARKLGATPNRCADDSVSMPETPWRVVCDSGHDLGGRHRRSLNLERSICGRCRMPLRYVPAIAKVS